jgi:GTP cyclohydrolase II
MHANHSDSISSLFRCVPTVERSSSATVSTHLGDVRVIVFAEPGSRCEHVAFVHGQVTDRPDVPVCMRARCVAEGEASEAVWQDDLSQALTVLGNEDRGVLVVLRRPSDPEAAPPARADERDYVIAADILRDLRVRSVRLMGSSSH